MPDIAIISAGVVSRSATATGALQDAADRMQRVLAALKRAGVDGSRHPDEQHQPQSRISLCREPAAPAHRLYGLEPADDPLPRHPQLGKDPRCAGQPGRQPDQRAQPDDRQARGGARRSARQGDRRRPRARRALCAVAGAARRARRLGERERRLCRAAASAADGDANGACRRRRPSIEPGEQKLQVTRRDDVRAAVTTKRPRSFCRAAFERSVREAVTSAPFPCGSG